MNFLAKKIALLVLLWFIGHILPAQNYTQTLKGTVQDKALKSPLPGVTVVLASTEPVRGTVTDAEGRFSFANVPVGKHALRLTYLGYKEATQPNIVVNSGKETDLTLDLEESVVLAAEVVIKAKAEKEKPLNELSTVSARTFSVEETRRFAAAVNDPGRMASSYAGVAMPNDGNNTIVIRGNAPNGLLWRMEGVDIPNPNHFSAVGTSGGGISILSAQLLANSDFMTGAFAAEYGNALSGVFDLKMRKGNTEKREYTLQAGVLGLDVAAEGPLRLGLQRGSFLFNYRYSTLSILSKIGVNIGDAQTDFQDLSFNFLLPAGKAGVFTLFGLGGLSTQQYQGEADSLLWEDDTDKRHEGNFGANTGVVGLTHSKVFGSKTALRTVVAASGTRNKYYDKEYQYDYTQKLLYHDDHRQNRLTLSTTLTHKFNARHLLRTGAYFNRVSYDLAQSNWDEDSERLEVQLENKGKAPFVQAFAQWQFRPTERLTLNLGAHSLFNLENDTRSIEPRAAVKYAFSERQSLSIGYGLHGQLQPLGIYFAKVTRPDGSTFAPNRNLGLTRSHHLVLSYDLLLPGNWRIKPEAYVQFLEKVPVRADIENTYSVLNEHEGFTIESLANKGAGRNAGLELTVEKFLTRGFYMLLSSAVYDARYRGSDRVWHSTRFNSNFVHTLTTGKEWDWNRRGKDRTFGLNLKLINMGGLRQTPLDLEASHREGKAVYDNRRAWETRMPDYFRLDVGLRIKRNYPHMTTTLALDVQNATNRQNIFGRSYDKESGTEKDFYSAPLIPILSYRLEF